MSTKRNGKYDTSMIGGIQQHLRFFDNTQRLRTFRFEAIRNMGDNQMIWRVTEASREMPASPYYHHTTMQMVRHLNKLQAAIDEQN